MRVPLSLLALLVGACGDVEPRRLSAVLITLDTTNPGALDLYGRDRGVTPNLAALAGESVVFDAAWSVAPLTLPSHASILTGLYPPRHGLRDNGLVPLPESARTLAERAGEAGYETAAFVAAVVLGRMFGLDQGFDVYDEPARRGGTVMDHMVERDADSVTDAALRWLVGRDRARPFFLWVHYFDPHAPYDPPEASRSQAGGQAYLGEVAYMDAAIGRLLDALAGEVGLDELVLCVVADHGEALGRHGEPTHSVLCYDVTQRVPLLVRRPGEDGGAEAGRRSARVASIADVYPTFLQLLELGAPGDVDGRSLFGPEEPGRGVYLESYCGYLNYGWSPLVGWVQDGYKYLHSSAPELYDLNADPGEENDLLAEQPERAESMRGSIAALYERAVLTRESDEGSVGDVQVDLQALGYAGAASAEAEIPHPLDPSGRPAPASRMGELQAFYEAALLAAAGRREKAITALEAVIRENPGNFYARGTVSGLLVELGQHAKALPLLQGLLEEGHDRAVVRVQLADCLVALGRGSEAVPHLERAVALQPERTDVRDRLAYLLKRLGRGR